MKVSFSLLTIVLFLCSCDVSKKTVECFQIAEESALDYPKDLIKWADLFKIDKEEYFVYVFSYDCFHCKEIKDKVMTFSSNCEIEVLFLEYSNVIPIRSNVSKTIGVSDLNEVYIKGTPTLILIKNGVIMLNVGGKAEVLSIISLY